MIAWSLDCGLMQVAGGGRTWLCGISLLLTGAKIYLNIGVDVIDTKRKCLVDIARTVMVKLI